MGTRFDVQASSVFVRVVLQIERKSDHPVALFPMDLAATLLFPRRGVFVPAPKAVEDGKRLGHEDEVVTGERPHQIDEPLVEEQPANLRMAGEDVHQAGFDIAWQALLGRLVKLLPEKRSQ